MTRSLCSPESVDTVSPDGHPAEDAPPDIPILKPLTPPPDFNRLAIIYKWMEWVSFGPWLQRCRCAFLNETRACRHALIFGDGDGRFTQKLLRINRSIQVEAVDASGAMLKALVRRAAADAGRVTTHQIDARCWSPSKHPGALDLVATHFFLDCLTTEETAALACAVRAAAHPEVMWIISEFDVPDGWFGRWIARPLVAALYRSFARMTGLTVQRLPDHRGALNGAGFACVGRRKWLGGLLLSEIWRGSQ